MLYRDSVRPGKSVLKLHVDAIQSSVHYYQIIKNFIVATGIEPVTYVLNYNISVALP